MAEKEQTASIKASVVMTTEPTFKPPKITDIDEDIDEYTAGETINADNAVKQVFAVLEPEEIADSTYYDPEYLEFYDYILPPYISSYQALPKFEAAQKELILNIESTGAKPWESRIVCIGVLDPNVSEPVTMNFIQETEEATIQEFIEWFESQAYDTLIGYNVAFDYRFLYVCMQKYRFEVPAWKNLKLIDLMQQQKQVKEAFVYGMNPEGKLQDWSTYLFGLPEYAPQEQVFTWVEEKNLEEIANFNSDKLVKSYYLYVLGKLVDGKIPGAEVVARQSVKTEQEIQSALQQYKTTAAENITVACPNCMQKQEMPKTAKIVYCEVCGTTITNPNL